MTAAFQPDLLHAGEVAGVGGVLKVEFIDFTAANLTLALTR